MVCAAIREPLWGYLDARKHLHSGQTPTAQSVASFPLPLPRSPPQRWVTSSAATPHHCHQGQATTTSLACPRSLPRPGVPQCSPARGWRWGTLPGTGFQPSVPCDAWRKFPAASHDLSRLSPSLSPGSQLASVASFFSLAIPSLSPSWDFASSVPAAPRPQCPRNTLPQTFPWLVPSPSGLHCTATSSEPP